MLEYGKFEFLTYLDLYQSREMSLFSGFGRSLTTDRLPKGIISKNDNGEYFAK